MSSFVLRRCASNLKLPQTEGAAELFARCKTNQWQKPCRQANTPLICTERFIHHRYQNCYKTTCASLRTPHHLQKCFFSYSAPRFLNRSFLFNSSKTSRKSASVIATSPTEAREQLDFESSRLQPRYIYVHTSANRWEDVPGGLVFDTAYLDSRPGERINSAVPLVVSLHNTPGSFYDMLPVLEAFAKSGCRVLAPAFPGQGYTEGIIHSYNDVFSHSTSEKAEFVRDFLVTLDVKKVDLLISHGCGCYPAMRLTAGKDTTAMFKSTAFLSPWPLRHFRGTSQKNLLPLLHDLWERPFYRPFARAFSRFLTNASGARVQERMAMVYTLYNLHFEEVGGFGIALDSMNFPRVMFFAEDDQFVDAELSYELAEMMGISGDCTHRFAGQLERGKMDQFPSCLVFDKGGQHIHMKQSGVITAVLFNLLKSVRPAFLAV